jgi:hypothetical protein
VRNIDGTTNKKGEMTHYVMTYITVGDKRFLIKAHIVGLGKESLVLGFPWLQKVNPMINWTTGAFRFRDEFQRSAI